MSCSSSRWIPAKPCPSRDSARRPIDDEVHLDEMRHGACTHFLHHFRAMDLDGTLAQAQVDGHDLVGLSLDDQVEHLPLAGGQRLHASVELGLAREALAILQIELQGMVDVIEQLLIAKRLL